MKLMETDEQHRDWTLPNLGDTAYDVVVVEPDARRRTTLVSMIGGRGARSFESVAELVGVARRRRARRSRCSGRAWPTTRGSPRSRRSPTAHPGVGVVLVAEQLTTALLQKALRSGVRDAVVLDESETERAASPRSVGSAAHGRRSRPRRPVPRRRDAPGKVVVCFSTKGGVGKSVLSTNLAVALAQRSDRPVAIVDADLQFGDVARAPRRARPSARSMDAAAAIHHDDPELMRALVMRHDPSGLLVLPAPVEPSTADQIRPEDMLAIIDSMRQFCGTIVVDMPPHFDDLVLALLEIADEVLLVASMDIPSIKNLKVGMQTLDLLALAGPKLRLVLNRANARVKLDVKEVEKALGPRREVPGAVRHRGAAGREPRRPGGARQPALAVGARVRRHRNRVPGRRQRSTSRTSAGSSAGDGRARAQGGAGDDPAHEVAGVPADADVGAQQRARGAPAPAAPARSSPTSARCSTTSASSAPELRRQVQEALHAALAEEKAPLSAMEKAQLVQDVTDDVLGYGPIDRFLKDPEINEVMVNGPDHVYVERRGVIEHTDVTFADETHLRRIIDKIVSEVGRRVDEATPMVDARLPDGSRVERGRPAALDRRSVPHHPPLLGRPLHGRRPRARSARSRPRSRGSSRRACRASST